MIPTAGLFVAVAIYATAWFSVLTQNYIYAIAYGLVAFTLWLLSLDLKELLKEVENDCSTMD